MKKTRNITLPSSSAGTTRSIKVIQYGEDKSYPKVYIQAGLHADEAPGYLVAHHLEQLLDKAEIIGQIILVPAANPIGLGQWKDDSLLGRFDFSTAINFNRQHYDLVNDVAERIEGKLTDNHTENVTLIRNVTADILSEMGHEDEAAFLKKQLLTLAHDADIVLDLHCDHEALVHLYMGTPLWPDGADLAALLGADVTLLAKNSGDNPFDEACSRLWWDLAEKFPANPIPPACLSVTVELRGIANTDKEMVRKDAENIALFLARRKVISGDIEALPPLKNDATPLTGVDYVKAPAPGIISYLKQPGAWVKKGDIIAEITNPLPGPEDKKIHLVKTKTDGLLFTRNIDRFARPGRVIAKVAGKAPLRHDDEKLLTQ